ncbi:hypothetical protein [Hyalangium rubrum]|uniref:Uncharacterized protein n=1 Tax=Hyalangium rubrum TaxID=3103134 RepID=A0ABU5HEX6_9BACT|nr:hypothetical protein [Hyalangium sp. s54d21]MDY7231357.1 hypothetical protein [Hyalangium sp. s54d21]
MERIRSPGPSEDLGPDTIHPLPETHALQALLVAVQSPGALQEEVDALQQALAQPLAEGESPRVRADFLLSLLEAREATGLKGSDGRTLRTSAVEALIALGYPYALEVPPEALDEAHRARANAQPRDIPALGIGATLVGLIAQGLYAVPLSLEFIDGYLGSSLIGLFLLGAALGPSLSALLGGWLRSPGLQRVGVIAMALVGSVWLALAALGFASEPLGHPFPLVAVVAGLSLVLGSVLLRHPEWLAQEDEAPATPEAPEAPDDPLR